MQCRSCAPRDERLDKRRRESKNVPNKGNSLCQGLATRIMSWFSVFGLHFGPNIWKHRIFDCVKWLINAHIWRASRRPLKGSPTGWRIVGTAWMTVSKARLNVVGFNDLWILLLWTLLITALCSAEGTSISEQTRDRSFQKSLTGTYGRIDRNVWIHCVYHNFNSVGKRVTITIEQIVNLSWMACHQCHRNCHIL